MGRGCFASSIDVLRWPADDGPRLGRMPSTRLEMVNRMREAVRPFDHRMTASMGEYDAYWAGKGAPQPSARAVARAFGGWMWAEAHAGLGLAEPRTDLAPLDKLANPIRSADIQQEARLLQDRLLGPEPERWELLKLAELAERAADDANPRRSCVWALIATQARAAAAHASDA